MGYSYNHGLVTPMKGAVIFAARIKDLDEADGDDCTVADQGSAGYISSVEHDATGVYIIKLAAPYPPRLIACFPQISSAGATDDLRFARYDVDGYDEETGWITIHVTNDDDAGAGVAADGSATDELHVMLIMARYSII